ncbi:MAG: ABC transporter substrate-binding protein [Alphaproteobacteria bacterium]|nr:ABC transporter substrate-binding protein [Alphaproteobacteria bacterium]MBV9965989.1 ABC transporter substrate-binding protein [Alphaproteobacteria bacterium]
MAFQIRAWAVALGALLAAAMPAGADETPKRGGILTYLIPADAPPSFDGHRETTYVTVHTGAPFYSVLIRINPENPSSTTDFVCDLCTEMPQPAEGGKTYTFKIRQGVKFHDGSPLSAVDVAASWNEIIFPPEGVLSPRASNFMMVDKVEAPDPQTVVFHLKFATTAFLPALADPFGWIYKKDIIDKDPHWYEKNIMGSGPFKFAGYEVGQSIKGERNPDYYHEGKPYLDGFVGLYAPKQATRIDALRSDRASIEFRGLPPSARDELKSALGDQIAVQESDWNCGSVVTINEKRKPFDDVRVRRALTLAVDRWHGAPALSKIADVRTVGSIVFPADPLAPNKDELSTLAGFSPDIEKSRAEAKRLLKEAGQEGLSFELLNRDVDQPYKYVGIWIVDEWSKIGLKVTQKVLPTGPWFEAERSGNFAVDLQANCHSIVNPLIDVQPYLPTSVSEQNYGNYEDPQEMELYDKTLHETDPQKQHALMFQFAKHVMDEQAHKLVLPWWYRIVPYRSYVKGWKISPSHYLNQDLATIWLDK